MTQTTKSPSAKSRKLAKRIFDQCVSVSFSYEELNFDETLAAKLIDKVYGKKINALKNLKWPAAY